MEQKSNPTKIIIVTAVIIIVFVSIIVGVMFAVSSNNNEQNKILQNLVQNAIQEEEEENTILDEKNIIITDDQTADFSRRHGRIEVIWIDENNNEISKPLKPNLNGLTPVKFDANMVRFIQTTSDDDNWYNYDLNLWANAVDSNGSYFVWIPRYAYRITYYSNSQYTKVVGYCDGRGIMKLNEDNTLTRICTSNTGIRETANHYIVAPAFSKDTASGYRNGGWDYDLPGFWTSKYEMSMETNGVHTETINSDIGNVQINEEVKAVSKPCVSSWRNINIRNCYLNGYNYDRNRDSHLMKSSEWGAIAYLAYSQYGRNGKIITQNSSSGYITGGTTSEESLYLSNGNQSTTGNSTGVYDLSGGAWEYVSAYIDNGYYGLADNGGTTSEDLYGSNNSKYKTIYPHNSNDDGDDYEERYSLDNFSLVYRYRGDALFETSDSGFGNDSFDNNTAYYLQSDIPYLIRGGDYNSGMGAGIFSYNGYSGASNSSESFRVVLI